MHRRRDAYPASLSPHPPAQTAASAAPGPTAAGGFLRFFCGPPSEREPPPSAPASDAPRGPERRWCEGIKKGRELRSEREVKGNKRLFFSSGLFAQRKNLATLLSVYTEIKLKQTCTGLNLVN